MDFDVFWSLLLLPSCLINAIYLVLQFHWIIRKHRSKRIHPFGASGCKARSWSGAGDKFWILKGSGCYLVEFLRNGFLSFQQIECIEKYYFGQLAKLEHALVCVSRI